MERTALKDSPLWKEEMDYLVFARGNPSSRAVRYPSPDVIPTTFNGVQEWAEFMPRELPKLCGCGASWAAAATYALTVRYRLWTLNQLRQRNGKKLALSFGKVAGCNYGGVKEYAILDKAMRTDEGFQTKLDEVYNQPAIGCDDMETLLGAWQYLLRFGSMETDCVSDADFGVCTASAADNKASQASKSSAAASKAPKACFDVISSSLGRCADGSPARLYRAGGFYTLPPDPQVIKQEVYKWGPVTTAMEVTHDIDKYANMSGVYSPPSLTEDRPDLAPRANDRQKKRDRVATALQGVAVVILGWGINQTTQAPHWIVAAWDRGFMRVAMGVNAGGIESNVVAGYPDVPMAPMFMPYTSMKSEIDTFVGNVWPIHESGYKETVIDEELLKGRDITLNAPDLVSEDMIPDYSTMIAGQPLTITFPYRGNVWRQRPEVYYFLVMVLMAAVVIVTVSVLVM